MGHTQSPIASLLERPVRIGDDGVFDFEKKYIGGGKKGGVKSSGKMSAQGYSEIPANLPKALYAKAEQIGLDVYKALGCEGFARVDMLINSATDAVYFNEVNPMPGQLYNHNWRQKGISALELVEKLLELAQEKHSERQKLNTVFNTNFLAQF